MKKFIIILISITLLFLSFTSGFLVKKQIDDNDLMMAHQIDIEEKKCIALSSVYDYPHCSKMAENAWDNRIQKNLELLKKVMPNEEFKHIYDMNETWKKSAYKEIDIINKFISNNDGILYQTDGNNKIVQIKKQYALLLEDIYYNYQDK